jgi:hypothetical protein
VPVVPQLEKEKPQDVPAATQPVDKIFRRWRDTLDAAMTVMVAAAKPTGGKRKAIHLYRHNVVCFDGKKSELESFDGIYLKVSSLDVMDHIFP